MNLLTLAANKLASVITSARRSYVAMRQEPENVSTSATVATVQSAIRLAEGGDTRQLFALYRDLTVGGSHIQCELGKRLMAVLSQPEAVLPADKDNKDDIAAAAAIEQMIADCENWEEGVAHLLSSALWPVSVVEKVFAPAPPAMPGKPKLSFTLKKLHIVNPTLLCFKQPYQVGRDAPRAPSGSSQLSPLNSEEPWEKDLRFYETDANGTINWSYDKSYAADPTRHIVHRGHLLVGMRDNWGGPMRSIVFWWLLGVLGRDWFARAMERYGSPFPVGKTDAQNQDAINLLRDAFSLSTKIGGLVVDNDTQVELIQAMTTGIADAHEKFLSICNREISKVIVGQTLSAEAQPTGLGSGTSELQGQVREDIRAFDQKRLGSSLARQLFTQFLFINGLSGRVKIVWGGLSAEDAAEVATLLVSLSQASLEPTDEAIPTLSERVGFQLQRKAAPEPSTQPGSFGGGRLAPQFAKPWPDLNGVGFGGLKTFAAEGLASGLGVPVAWLAPLRLHLAEIERKAQDKSLTDAEMLTFLQAANDRLPELFSTMDIDALAQVFEAGMGAAVIDGVRGGLQKQAKTLPGSKPEA